MKIHRIAADVTIDLFDFYQRILPHGERGQLIPKILADLKQIHKADPSIIRKYLEDKITILDLKEELTNGSNQVD